MRTRTVASALAIFVALAAGLSIAPPVRADTRPGFYLGVGGGNSHLELGDEQLSVEANDIGYQVFAGYNFGRYFAIEAAWFDAGVLTDEVLGLDLEFGLDGFIGQHWGLRIEYQSIDLSDGDFFMLGVSGLYRFGYRLSERRRATVTRLSFSLIWQWLLPGCSGGVTAGWA